MVSQQLINEVQDEERLSGEDAYNYYRSLKNELESWLHKDFLEGNLHPFLKDVQNRAEIVFPTTSFKPIPLR